MTPTKGSVSELKCSNSSEPAQNGSVGLDEMTSKDYYFDSYAHFGIHEVCITLFNYFFNMIG